MDHLDLVEIATNYVGDPHNSPTIDRDDLIGEGQIALMQAARRYDPEKGSFRSFAFTRIKGAMIDALRRDFLLPRSARERGESLTVVSINKPIGEGGLTLSDTIEDARSDVEEIVANRAQLASAIEERAHEAVRPDLTPMELEVLRGAAVGETAGETASRLGKSHETGEVAAAHGAQATGRAVDRPRRVHGPRRHRRLGRTPIEVPRPFGESNLPIGLLPPRQCRSRIARAPPRPTADRRPLEDKHERSFRMHRVVFRRPGRRPSNRVPRTRVLLVGPPAFCQTIGRSLPAAAKWSATPIPSTRPRSHPRRCYRTSRCSRPGWRTSPTACPNGRR